MVRSMIQPSYCSCYEVILSLVHSVYYQVAAPQNLHTYILGSELVIL